MAKKKVYYDLEFIKKEELRMLILFDQVCQKYNLKYSLSGGTLLGAVRHGGFIPWDDDVDVLMLRKDYQRFCTIFNKEFSSHYFLQTYETDLHYLNSFGKILNLDIPAYILETEMLDIKKGICIDIFPIDKTSDNYILRKLDIFKLSIISILKYSSMARENENRWKKIWHNFCSILSKTVGTHNLNVWETKIRTHYQNKKSSVTYGDYVKAPYKLTESDLYPYEIFKDYSTIMFEGHLFSTISDYKKYLTITYGDYMSLPPKEEQIPGHNFFHY